MFQNPRPNRYDLELITVLLNSELDTRLNLHSH